MRIKTLFTLAVPLAAGGLALAWTGGLLKEPASRIVYDTAEVGRGSIRKIVTTSGPVRALVTVSIGSQLSGQIDKVPADFNTEVQEGDTLATLDDKTFKARVAQAEADLSVAQANLVNQDAALKKSRAIALQAERNIERQKALQTKGFASTATLENAERDLAVANADIAVAEAQIASAKATIEQRKAALSQAQIDLDRSIIRAPISGTVISRTVDPGQTVAASLQAPELFKIAQDLRRIRIEAQVNEADVGEVAEGNAVTFSVDAYPDREFKGKVTQVRLAATELNNVVTYTVIIEAANDDRKLFPGMTANVQVEAARRDDVVRLPNDALRYKPKGEVAGRNGGGRGEGRGENRQAGGRQVERLKEELKLTEAQEQTLRDGIAKLIAERRGNEQDSFDPSTMRQLMQARIEQVLTPVLTDAQRELFDKWKQGREGQRMGTVYTIGADGMPERRMVRIGISDDQFTEVAGGRLKEGDRVVLRAKEQSR